MGGRGEKEQAKGERELRSGSEETSRGRGGDEELLLMILQSEKGVKTWGRKGQKKSPYIYIYIYSCSLKVIEF